jgi:hypothetical protein
MTSEQVTYGGRCCDFGFVAVDVEDGHGRRIPQGPRRSFFETLRGHTCAKRGSLVVYVQQITPAIVVVFTKDAR